MTLSLHPEMTYRVKTTDALRPTTGSPRGALQYWRVSEASLEGDRIKASLAGVDRTLCRARAFTRTNFYKHFRKQFRSREIQSTYARYTARAILTKLKQSSKMTTVCSRVQYTQS